MTLLLLILLFVLFSLSALSLYEIPRSLESARSNHTSASEVNNYEGLRSSTILLDMPTKT